MNANGQDAGQDGREAQASSGAGPQPSAQVLRALDDTVADLQALGRSPVAVAVPADVATRLDALLAGLATSVAPPTNLPTQVPTHVPTQVPGRVPGRVPAGGTVTDLAAHRRRRTRRAGPLGAVAAGLGIVGVGAAVVVGVAATAQNATPGNPTATRLELGSGDQLGTTVLAALGASDLGARLSDPTTLQGCLRANGAPAGTELLGSAQVTLKGRPGTLLLLPTGTAGSFVALVVGPGCSAGVPALIASAQIGR